MIENYINHVVFVLDASGSMQPFTADVVKAFDGQIAYLARRSQEMDQETRVSVFAFNTDFRCLVYDKDVLRLPSLAALYHAAGQTALIDATMLALEDMAATPEKYGSHAFLVYVLTDGQENASYRFQSDALQTRITGLRPNWTVACLVPNQTGVYEAKRFGFPPDNIAVWDTTTRQGFETAVNLIQATTDQFMSYRTQGVTGTRNLFKLDASALTPQVVTTSLVQLSPVAYRLLSVHRDASIRDFVEQSLGHYVKGNAYYQITKPETVQGYKQVCVRDRAGGAVYAGPNARRLLNLPDYDVRVSPENWSQYDIFIQSTSVNRRLVAGTNLLVLL